MRTLLLSLAFIAVLTGALRAQAQYGSPDPTYSSFQGGCNAITALEDGSAYVDAVTGAPSLTPYAIARLTPRGELDTAWGANGLVPFSPPAFMREFQLLNGKDGGLFVIASGVANGAAGTIQRLAADGRPELSFGNAGTLVLPPLVSAVLQPDGKIVALLANNGLLSYSFLRFTARGEPDPTFGHEGTLTVPVPPLTSGSPGGFGPGLYGWAVRSDGGVELAFYSNNFLSVPEARLVPMLLVFPGDSLAASNAGARLVPQGIATWISPLAKVEPSGALVLVGPPPVTVPPPLIERFGAGGSLDSGFRVDTVGQNLAPHAIWREPDGQWTYVGANLRLDFCGQHCGYIGSGTNNLQAIRYDDSGNFNLPFGSRLFGNARGKNQLIGELDPLAHTSDGKVLYAGQDCALKRYLTDSPRTETTVVEYYHPALDHYFMTSSANEIALLDDNPPLGWIRTGYSFGGWAPGNLPGTVPVCRFYGDPVIGPNSHFYTGEDFECELLMRLDALTPPGMPAWHLEGKPFNMVIPLGGQCPANLAPVYRVYNGPAAGPSGPNHRYTTDPAIYAQMLAKGWLPEGVHFCAPPAIN